MLVHYHNSAKTAKFLYYPSIRYKKGICVNIEKGCQKLAIREWSFFNNGGGGVNLLVVTCLCNLLGGGAISDCNSISSGYHI